MTDLELREKIRQQIHESLLHSKPPADNPYNDPTTGWHWIARAKAREGRPGFDLMKWRPTEKEETE